tara:strand:- start:465 stop:1553 length:1089 start_codon:yes stop_codon:yes gene_type:complete
MLSKIFKARLLLETPNFYNKMRANNSHDVGVKEGLAREICKYINLNSDDKVMVYYHPEFLHELVVNKKHNPENIWFITDHPQRKLYALEICNIPSKNICCVKSKEEVLKGVQKIMNKKPKLKFDVIIGNPPYNEKSKSDKKSSKQKGNKNLCMEFVKHSMQLLRDEESLIAFVTPNHWIRNSNSIKKKLLQGSFVYANIDSESIKTNYFPGIGSTFTYWVWKNCKGNNNIYFGDSKINIDQSLVPISPNTTFEDWDFLNQVSNENTKESLSWKRTDDIQKMDKTKHVLIVERAFTKKGCYVWDGLTRPKGDWYFVEIDSKSDANHIMNYIKTDKIQRVLSLIKSGMAMTHEIKKVPLKDISK